MAKTPKPAITYSRIVVIRVSHTNPVTAVQAAEVLKEELKTVLTEWCRITPQHPKVELITLGHEDSPISDERPC
jgi:hypothetical protein